MYVFLKVHMYVALYPLVLELQVVVSQLSWVRGTERGSSGRALHTLNPQASSLALIYDFY